jgi:hypothetical protein
MIDGGIAFVRSIAAIVRESAVRRNRRVQRAREIRR